MPTGIVFTTNSFYKIETEHFSCKSKLLCFMSKLLPVVKIIGEFSGFFTDSVAKSHDYRPMFVCELTKNKEYLLCYNIYGVFVDANGNKTRGGEMKWPYSPNSFGMQLIILSTGHTIWV